MNDFQRSSRPRLCVALIAIWWLGAEVPAAANGKRALAGATGAQIAGANLGAPIKVAPQLAAPLIPQGGQVAAVSKANQWLVRRNLDGAAVQSGSVKAVVDGRIQALTLTQLGQGVAHNATVLMRLKHPAQPIPVPDAVKALNPNILAKQAVELPLEISGVDRDTDMPVKLRARVAEGTGLIIDPSLRVFVDSVYVLLVDPHDPGRRLTLKEPIDVMLEAVGATAEPQPIRLANTATPLPVTIRVPDPTGKTFPITVRADLDDVGDTLKLQVVPPRVLVSAENSSMVGWGIGTTRIHLESAWLRRQGGYDVTVLSDAGGFSPSAQVHLNADGLGETVLRSDHRAGTRVWVGDRDSADFALVEFRSPWLFLAMAAVGGLAGAFLRRKGRQRWLPALSIGVVTAVGAAVLYAVGYAPKLAELAGGAQLATNGEAMVAGIGFLAALVGVSWFVPGLEKTARKP
jgi:hypothetical protein